MVTAPEVETSPGPRSIHLNTCDRCQAQARFTFGQPHEDSGDANEAVTEGYACGHHLAGLLRECDRFEPGVAVVWIATDAELADERRGHDLL